MEKPVKIRPKPIELEAMPYTGENAEAIFKWVLQTDPMSSYQTTRWGFGTGSSIVPVVPFMEIHTFSYAIRVWKGMWLVRTEGIFKPLHDNYVQSKYDCIWPEPLPGI